MSELKKALSGADDDYLTGLSNKGTLKRAYKDLETAKISASYIDDSAYVTVDGTQCVIIPTLAESSCTCPSRSICRHIITSILWLKKELLSDEELSSPDTAEKKESPLVKELIDIPAEKLRAAMKKKYFNSFLEKAKLGIYPRLEEMTSITAEIPEDNAVVKLIHPLEHSACTCHGDFICKHMAAAILTWKIKHDRIKLSELVPIEDKGNLSDAEKMHDTAEYVRVFLERFLSDGIVRMPEDIAQQAEAAAVMCHNARLADCERELREMGKRLEEYISHSPGYKADKLFSKIIETIISLKKILDEDDAEKLKELGGDFRKQYTIADTMYLLPLAKRSFSSMSGYAGDIYYFLNKFPNGTPPIVTYSDIRPTFYSGVTRAGTSSAPWGLYGNCDELMKHELKLTLPKLSGIKLSSSNDTKAEIVCNPNLSQKPVYDKIYTDYRKLIEENFFDETADDDSESPVLLLADKCISSLSDEISQTHTIVIEDSYGQKISLKVNYTSQKAWLFAELQKIGKIMMEDNENKYVIFGTIREENDCCNIYPIAIFDDIDVPAVTDNSQDHQMPSGYYMLFGDLFKDISGLLCDIMQCGINSFDFYDRITELQVDCENSGLMQLGKLLKELYDIFLRRSGKLHEDNMQIIKLSTDIYSYIQCGIKKIALKIAVQKLYIDLSPPCQCH